MKNLRSFFNPEKYILAPGRRIFFLKNKDAIIDCVALIMEKNSFELTQIAISTKHHGEKLEQKLFKFAINFAKTQHWQILILYCNRKLENVLHIYRKYGLKNSY